MAAVGGVKRAGDAVDAADASKQAAVSGAEGVYGKTEFLDTFKSLTDELITDILPQYELSEEALAYIKRAIEYTVPGGKLNRGLTVVHAFQSLKGETALTATELKHAAVLGWCVEWLQAFFLVADDIMDESVTRRGGPCWYKLPDVKLVAINDSFLLKSHIYLLLRKYFKTAHPDVYASSLDLFLDTTVQTELGQLLDLTSNPMDGPTDLDRFTIERYNYIVKYKTAFYSFYLPIALAMVLSGHATDANLETAKEILVEMGTYFQVQDDYLDCYGTPEVIGKIGTDIQDNKCSWLVVQALQQATPEQKAFLKEHYGKHNDDDVAAIKGLYAEMGLEAQFKAYEEASYASLKAKIDAVDAAGVIPGAVFHGLLAKIYKREK